MAIFTLPITTYDYTVTLNDMEADTLEYDAVVPSTGLQQRSGGGKSKDMAKGTATVNLRVKRRTLNNVVLSITPSNSVLSSPAASPLAENDEFGLAGGSVVLEAPVVRKGDHRKLTVSFVRNSAAPAVVTFRLDADELTESVSTYLTVA